MNLDDLTLLRSWIRHMDWADLDAQRLENGESARKRIKALRRGLAVKSRFYGNPAWAKLWLGERLSTLAWERRALNALTTLNGLPDPSPALNHAVAQWFPESLCAALPFKVKTLADLVDLLEAFFAGATELSEDLKRSLKSLTGFFDGHAQQLGYQINKQPQPSALPVPLINVAPLERVLIPLELNGETGSNRSVEPCRINANHDLDAIKSWLALKDDNLKTYHASLYTTKIQ